MQSLIGWLATVLTIVSFIPKGEVKIRAINGIACIVWIVYAIIIKEVPLVVVNSVVLVLHIRYFLLHQPKMPVLDPDFMYKWIRSKSGVSGESELKLGYGVYNNMGDKKPLSYVEYHKKRDQLAELWDERNKTVSEINKMELIGITGWAKWFGWKVQKEKLKRLNNKINNFK